MRPPFSISILSILGLLLVPPAPAQTDSSPSGVRALQATRLQSASITLDGHLREPGWEQAAVATDFTQQEPVEGGSPSQRTEVRILYTDSHLYIGAVFYHDDPATIAANRRRRDVSLASDDRFMWTLDTYNDGRDAYFFETNPVGLRGDGLLTGGQGFEVNKSWDGIWDVEVSRGDYGWTAEIRIPFRTVQFTPTQSTWGINFQRTIRVRNEELLWTGYKRNQGIFRPRFGGELRGLSGLSKGLGLEVTPYGAAKANREWDASGVETNPTVDAGGEVNYAVTPTLQSSLTLNTDFAEVEMDQRRVNLTRFPLFFPEKRDFFLEASNVFEFAPRSAQYPFFSRHVGLVGRETVPILAGRG